MDSNRRAILIGGLAATAEIGRAGRAATQGASVAQPGKEAPPQVDGTLRFDDESRAAAAEDFGHIARRILEGLLRPGSDQDVATMIRWAGDMSRKIAPQGQRHSSMVARCTGTRIDQDGGQDQRRLARAKPVGAGASSSPPARAPELQQQA
jgi:hypothetical protein